MRPTPGVASRTFAIHGYTLLPGNCPPLAGLGALRHLDLQVIAVHEVFARDAEARRGDLPDGAPPPVAVRIGPVTRGIFAPSPVLDFPPNRFIAIASVSWASSLIDPNDIARWRSA